MHLALTNSAIVPLQIAALSMGRGCLVQYTDNYWQFVVLCLLPVIPMDGEFICRPLIAGKMALEFQDQNQLCFTHMKTIHECWVQELFAVSPPADLC